MARAAALAAALAAVLIHRSNFQCRAVPVPVLRIPPPSQSIKIRFQKVSIAKAFTRVRFLRATPDDSKLIMIVCSY